jgi:hypothetical protein
MGITSLCYSQLIIGLLARFLQLTAQNHCKVELHRRSRGRHCDQAEDEDFAVISAAITMKMQPAGKDIIIQHQKDQDSSLA